MKNMIPNQKYNEKINISIINKQTKLFLFDIDGTLVESSKKILSKHGFIIK